MKPKDLGTALETRNANKERLNAAEAQYFSLTGSIQVNGPGESVVDFPFPVHFVKIPKFSYGHDLDPGQALIANQLPTCSISVLQWQSSTRDDGTIVYVGASFGVVTTGPAGQVMNVYWHMDGVGLRGPIPSNE